MCKTKPSLFLLFDMLLQHKTIYLSIRTMTDLNQETLDSILSQIPQLRLHCNLHSGSCRCSQPSGAEVKPRRGRVLLPSSPSLPPNSPLRPPGGGNQENGQERQQGRVQDSRQAAGPPEDAEESHVRRQLQSHVHVHPDQGHELSNEDGRRHVHHSQGTFQDPVLQSWSRVCFLIRVESAGYSSLHTQRAAVLLENSKHGHVGLTSNT